MKSKLALFIFLLFTTGLHGAEFMPSFKMPRVQEPKIPRRTVSITDFGAVSDGKTLNSEAIAKAIESVAKKGGGRVIIPAGLWLTGPIALKSNVELHLEEGALVQFVSDYELYPPIHLDFKGRTRTLTTSPLHAEGAENFAITGLGIMDGAGDVWRPVKKSKMTESQWKNLLAKTNGVLESGGDMWWPSREAQRDHRPNLMKLVNCRRILLEGVTFQNSPGWNLNPTLCEDLTIRNVTVRNPWYSQNGDGLDIENCRNVVLRNSRFDVGDDGICLKSGANEEGRRLAKPTENILIEDCVVYHAHGGVTIGSEMSSGVRNVRVNNCTFIGTDLGLRFKSTRGRGGVVEKIYISNVRMTDIITDAIGFNMYYGGQSPTEVGDTPFESKLQPVNGGTPQFRDIYIENVICHGAKQAVALQGLPEMPIRGIHLHNVSISAERGVICTDGQDITLENVEIFNGSGPVVRLQNSRDIQIDRLTYPADASAVVDVEGEKTMGIVIKNTKLNDAKETVNFSNGAKRSALTVN